MFVYRIYICFFFVFCDENMIFFYDNIDNIIYKNTQYPRNIYCTMLLSYSGTTII